jgi:mannose-6-phosphate isomerase-like protein (cupin superfamily)
MRGLVVLAVMMAGSAYAQSVAPLATAEPLPRPKVDLVHIPAQGARTFPMAEWDVVQQGGGEQTGERVLIAEGQEAVSQAPATASRYTARAYKFPTGQVRILHWKKESGPVVHAITFETELFILAGSVDVEVQGQKVRVGAGDAVSLPSGVLRNPSPAEDTIVAQFFVEHAASSPKAAVVRGADIKETWTAQWMDGQTAKTARTPDDFSQVPASAARWSTKRYAFDGNSVRYALMKKGGRSHLAKTQRADALIYVVSGKLRRTEGSVVFEASAGDALRELKGVDGYWEILEESVFIATDAPFNPVIYRPNP